ncbi:unnamed protein product [Rotaria sordida]|uniref:3CxxC-type domain-containing protein n=1 Tax=Rotaria sordida TaxID=392033 RepID=A0A813QWV2_9BILA|nr:unnamed protein product [Rotaria sordida]
MLAAAARRGTMPHTHCLNTMISNTSTNNKNSLTFESVVCTQLELKRRAESFSRRRSTVCRRPSIHIPTITSSNRRITSTSVPFKSQPNDRASISTASDISTQFLSIKNLNDDSKYRQISLTYSIILATLGGIGGRQSITSMFYWDGSSRNAPTIQKSESRASKWSIDFHKETPHYGSLRSRLIEEYTDCESLFEFVKKTILVLMKTKGATIFLGLLLILPIIMMGIGVSHLNDCPRQTNLPIYLFVAGIVWTTKLLQNIWHKYRLQQKVLNDEEPSSDHNDGHAFIDALMTSFLIIWFFLGHYWLITIGYPPHFEQLLENPDIWCHKTVVLCALASILITYFILITFVSLVIFLVSFTRYTIIKRASTNYQTCVHQARSVSNLDKFIICPNFTYAFHAELEINLNWNFNDSLERWYLYFTDIPLPIGWNYDPHVNDYTPAQVFLYPHDRLIISHNAKIKYRCLNCRNEWTTARGRAIFQAAIPRIYQYNILYIKLCTQQCRLCGSEIQPSWYLSEATRVMKNVCRILIEQFYSHRNFTLPIFQYSSSSSEEGLQQRTSQASGPHHQHLCRACHEGYCFGSHRQYQGRN